MKTLFLLLRISTGMMAVGALAILVLIILLRSAGQFAKESVGVVGYLIRLFTSGFTNNTPPTEPAGWVVATPQVVLALLFVGMLTSVFYPSTKILLHVIGAVTMVALIWYVWMMRTGLKLEIFCLPLLVIWSLYYAVCLFWAGNQASPEF